MDLLSILILLILAVWFVISIRVCQRKKGACDGCCSSCAKHCEKK